MGTVDVEKTVEVTIPGVTELEAELDEPTPPETVEGCDPSDNCPVPHGIESPLGCESNSGGVVCKQA